MLRLVICILVVCSFYFNLQGQEILQFVNPFIGTAPTLQPSNWDGHGRTYPGAVAPFGFIQLTPETRVSYKKGYDYRDKVIYFFSCFEHLSGYPDGSSGQCKIMPLENSNSFQINKYNRPFSHENETAEPGYYKVKFDDNGTTAEATSSTRAGMFRFVFDKNVNPKIFVGDIGDIVLVDNKVKGSKRNTWIEFKTPWQSFEKSGDGFIFTFNEQANKTLLMKLSSSSVGFENAKANLDAEIPEWDFERLKNETQMAWKKELSVIEIQDNSVQNKTKFYTALYHSLLVPWIISDADDTYIGYDGNIHKAEGRNQYGTFSPWDTFRSLHPLLCIIAPQRQKDMIISMLDIYKQTGQLPIEPMTGFHSIPIIVDSYLKGITEFDKILAYEAMVKLLLSEDKNKSDMVSYVQNGFVSSSYPESVTRTVEYAYNDWVLSNYAKNLINQHDDYILLMKRSLNYQNLFDPSQLFLVPRSEKDFIHSKGNFGYKEGDKWNYSFFVPHNLKDLINRMGGNKEFTYLLDSAIRTGHILFDNEPNFHIPYLFNYSNYPWKTQKLVANICDEYFTSAPNGLPGNDDLGSISSWFVFNAMGFLPICPGAPEYNIGTPLFERITIQNENGNSFVIKGLNSTSKNNYIQSATLNGEDFNQSWFKHSEISNGGELIFSLGPNPSNWAIRQNSEAFSITKNEAAISVDSLWSLKSEVDPNEPFNVGFSLKNTGRTGVKILRLFSDKKEVARKNVLVEEGEIVIDSVPCKLYKSGCARLNIDGNLKILPVNVRKSTVRQFEISSLSFFPFLKVGGMQEISYSVRNMGGNFDSTRVNIYINNKFFNSIKVEIGPGETVVQRYKISDFKTGINTIQVQNLTGVFKVYADNKKATLVDLCFQQTNDGVIKDTSGFSNHGIIKTTNSQNSDYRGFDKNSFVEIKNSSEFSFLKNEITMMVWVKFSNTDNYPISVIAQGDHNVIQLLNKNTIQFFAGGWGKGECNAVLTSSLQSRWHHIAGVADELSLKVYVDGKLMETVALEKGASLATVTNWNLGRNEEFPGQRIFKGKMDGVKILAAALSQEEITQIVNQEKKKLNHEK